MTKVFVFALIILSFTVHAATTDTIDSSAGMPGTADSRATPSVAAPAAGAASVPSVTPAPTSVPTSAPTSIPQSAFKEPAAAPKINEPTSGPPGQSGSGTNISLFLALIAGVLALIYGGLKLLKVKSIGENKGDEKKNNGKCNYLKATLDAKMQELTDLEGKLRGKLKGSIKGALEDAFLSEEEKVILKKIEIAKDSYEKIKALYEECIIDAESGALKTLKFSENLVDLILNGQKTATIRLFDDKGLKTGDIIELINSNTKKSFAKAKITEIIERKLGEINQNDLVGHEPVDIDIIESLKKYYGDKVGSNSKGKIVKFKLIK